MKKILIHDPNWKSIGYRSFPDYGNGCNGKKRILFYQSFLFFFVGFIHVWLQLTLAHFVEKKKMLFSLYVYTYAILTIS